MGEVGEHRSSLGREDGRARHDTFLGPDSATGLLTEVAFL